MGVLDDLKAGIKKKVIDSTGVKPLIPVLGIFALVAIAMKGKR